MSSKRTIFRIFIQTKNNLLRSTYHAKFSMSPRFHKNPSETSGNMRCPTWQFLQRSVWQGASGISWPKYPYPDSGLRTRIKFLSAWYDQQRRNIPIFTKLVQATATTNTKRLSRVSELKVRQDSYMTSCLINHVLSNNITIIFIHLPDLFHSGSASQNTYQEVLQNREPNNLQSALHQIHGLTVHNH